ncbi:MAG: ribonuclease Z [Defluviitaleaceae bacterium]|nr:ribonuclease Z [Defluviitaleaceae bacterium]
MIDIALVGTGGMMPLPSRFLSSMLCRVNGKMILFDCGEGTQVSLRLLGWGFKQIDIICFTHFHGDHISGLPGLLLTMANAERTEPLKLFGPPGLQHVVKSLCVIAQELPYELEFIEWPTRANGSNFHTFTEDMLTIKALPLWHRTPCFGYSIELMRRGKFDPERAKAQEIPLKLWGALQKQSGETIVYNGKTYSSDMVLGPPRKGLKVVFCTDTRPVPAMAGFTSEADLFICEGLYGDEERQEKAVARKHMTFQEAAQVAKAANAKELWLTHFSPAMPDPYNYIKNATDIFPNSVVGKDRMSKTLKYEE